MSISNALQTGVSGLIANSTRVGSISNNIANANTTGYRRQFADLVTTTTVGGSAAGVRAERGAQVDAAGSLRSTGKPTDLAIAGDGFFTVSRNVNDPAASNYFLTRAGSFTPDADGNLRNSAGYYLAGFGYEDDGTIGGVDRTGFGNLETVNIAEFQVSGEPTTKIDVGGNVPAQETGKATPGDPFLSTASYVTPLGASEQFQLAWQPAATANQWDVAVSDTDGTNYGSFTVDFHDSGTLAGAPASFSNVTNLATAPAGFAFDTTTGTATVTVANGATPQQVDLTFGAPDTFDGMTQFAGDYSPPLIEADGAEAGSLARIEIGDDGVVQGVFDNGERRALYEIPIAEVTNPNEMIEVDGNAYMLSRESGAFRLNSAGSGSTGSITAGAIENSNVEIAEELTDLIQTQRAFSSNAKIVTTMDEMLDEVTRIKR